MNKPEFDVMVLSRLNLILESIETQAQLAERIDDRLLKK
jgi:hypothetical protein